MSLSEPDFNYHYPCAATQCSTSYCCCASCSCCCCCLAALANIFDKWQQINIINKNTKCIRERQRACSAIVTSSALSGEGMRHSHMACAVVVVVVVVGNNEHNKKPCIFQTPKIVHSTPTITKQNNNNNKRNNNK